MHSQLLAAVGTFTGPVVPADIQTCPAGFGGLAEVVGGALGLLISLGILIAVLVLVYGGFLLVLNPINPENRSTAKKIMLNAAIGFIITLCSWLLVNTFLTVLGVGGISGATKTLFGGGTAGNCIVAKVQKGIDGGAAGGSGSGTQTNGGSGTGTGTCQVQTSGPCSADQMGAFGSNANNASEICFAESSGNARAEGDKIVGGVSNGNPVSFGLFQINVTANQIGGFNCPSAFDSRFTGSHKNVVITNQSLYNQCKAAGEDPGQNIVAAISISNNGTNWKPWSTASKCGLAVAYFPALALGDYCPYNSLL